MGRHPFLSRQWIVAVREIRDEYRHHAGETTVEIRANLTITETPFDEGPVRGHLDTRSGALSVDEGHLDDHDFHIEMTYGLALQLFVERDPQSVVSALLGGVKLTGDSSKVIMLAGMVGPVPSEADDERVSIAREIIARIDEVTAPRD